jgi:hypothetical protein
MYIQLCDDTCSDCLEICNLFLQMLCNSFLVWIAGVKYRLHRHKDFD